MTLGEKIKKMGYTQVHVHKLLGEKRINVNLTHFNRWCKNVYAPKSDYVYVHLAEILQISEAEVRNLFT